MFSSLDFFVLEETLGVVTARTGLPNYDFDFRSAFPGGSPQPRPRNPLEVAELLRQRSPLRVVSRIGPVELDDEWCEIRPGSMRDFARSMFGAVVGGLTVNSRADHDRCTRMAHWYPLIADLTLRSQWFDYTPSVAEVGTYFRWPLLVSTSGRSRNERRELTIFQHPNDYHAAQRTAQLFPRTGFHPRVFRESVPLRRMSGPDTDLCSRFFEFRSFWWKGELAGCGPYWNDGPACDWTADEQAAGIAVAREAAARLKVPFLVVDIAQTEAGRWIVIDCHDAQDCEYAGVPPVDLWRNIVSLEKSLASQVP